MVVKRLKSPFLKNDKLLPCQKEMLVWWRINKGLNYSELGLMFKVSRSMAYFICNPEKLKEYRVRNNYKYVGSNYPSIKKHREKVKKIFNTNKKQKK